MKSTLPDLLLIAFSFAVLGGFSACAQTPKKQCEINRNLEVTTHTPPVTPTYFFKPVGTGDEIAFVGFDPKTKENQNYLYDLKKETIIAIPGNLDPIALYGTDLMSTPLEDKKGHLSMVFYDAKELRVQGIKAKPLIEPDPTLNGRYQSMGVISRNGKKIRFRIITDGHYGGDFREFEADLSATPIRLKPLTKTKMICENLRKKNQYLEFKLPMISKDAKFLGAFDVRSQEMQLFRLDANGNCAQVKSPALGRGDIGKLDFSPDSKKVAFHFSDRSLDYTPVEFGAPRPSWQLRSVVYDFDRDTYLLLPYSGNERSTYYPGFLPNGHVLAIELGDEKAKFIETTLDPAWEISRARLDAFHQMKDEDFGPYQWLSNEWMHQCEGSETRSMRYNRLLLLLSLNEDQCKRLVEDAEVLPSREELKKLKAVCELLKRN